jgi:hypothetical protein
MIWFIHSAQQHPTASPNRAAIVSFVIGDDYEATWSKLCAPSWIAYAERIGVDLIVFKDRLDKTDLSRSPAWQKLLILALPWMQRYERIIWLDSDIIISRSAPNILEFAGPPEKVGLSLEGARLAPAEQQIYLERFQKTTLSPDTVDTVWQDRQYGAYMTHGLTPYPEQFNTGVMVLSPQHHRDLLLSVYHQPEVSRLYEQAYLSHRLLETGLAHVISPRFNWGIAEAVQLYLQEEVLLYEDPQTIARIVVVLVRAEMRNAYFLHFNGAMNLLKMFVNTPVEASITAVAA